MEISIFSAVEIFTNPGDLEIAIGQEKGSDKFSISILRGPRHNYKPLLTLRPFAETEEDAITEVKKILQKVHKNITKELENKESFVPRFLNPDGQKIDQSKVMNEELIEQILDELRKHQNASTCKMLAVLG